MEFSLGVLLGLLLGCLLGALVGVAGGYLYSQQQELAEAIEKPLYVQLDLHQLLQVERPAPPSTFADLFGPFAAGPKLQGWRHRKPDWNARSSSVTPCCDETQEKKDEDGPLCHGGEEYCRDHEIAAITKRATTAEAARAEGKTTEPAF